MSEHFEICDGFVFLFVFIVRCSNSPNDGFITSMQHINFCCEITSVCLFNYIKISGSGFVDFENV